MLRWLQKNESASYQLHDDKSTAEFQQFDAAIVQYKDVLEKSKPNTLFHINATELLNQRKVPSQRITLSSIELGKKTLELKQLTTLIQNMNRLLEEVEKGISKPIFEATKKYIPDEKNFNQKTRTQQEALLFSMDHFIGDCKSLHDHVNRFVLKAELENKTNEEDIKLISSFVGTLVNVAQNPLDQDALNQLLIYEDQINKKTSLSTNLTWREIAHHASTITTTIFTIVATVCSFYPPTMTLGMLLMGPAMVFMLIVHLLDVPDLSAQRSVVKSTKAIGHHAKTFLSQLPPAVQQPEANDVGHPSPSTNRWRIPCFS